MNENKNQCTLPPYLYNADSKNLASRTCLLTTNTNALQREKRKSNDSDIRLTSPDRLHTCTRAIFTIITALYLIAPIVVLGRLEALPSRLNAVIAFVVLFSAFLSLSSRATKYELMAATAAYALPLFFLLKLLGRAHCDVFF